MVQIYEEYVDYCKLYNMIPIFTFRDWVIEFEDYDADMCALWLLNEVGEI